MTTFAKPEDGARFVLGIYKQLNHKEGDKLNSRNFVAFAGRKRVPASDVQRGLNYARDKKWVSVTPDGAFQLTRDGFSEMQAVS